MAKDIPNRVKLDPVMYTQALPSVWPKLNTPDDKWKKEGEYSLQQKLSGDQLAVVQPVIDKYLEDGTAQLRELHKANPRIANRLKPRSLGMEGYPIKEELDDQGNPTGFYLLKSNRIASGVKKNGEAWTATIPFVDRFDKPIANDDRPDIWGGSILRAALQPYAWLKPGEVNVGLRLEIRGVQIIKLVQGGQTNLAFGQAQSDDDEDDTGLSNSAQDADDDGSADF